MGYSVQQISKKSLPYDLFNFLLKRTVQSFTYLNVSLGYNFTAFNRPISNYNVFTEHPN